MYDPKSLSVKTAQEFAVLARLTPEAMTSEARSAIRTKHHREILAASLTAKFPALPSVVCALVADDRGADALDEIAAALTSLKEADPNLFLPCPDKDAMLRLAIKWRGGAASDDQRASLLDRSASDDHA